MDFFWDLLTYGNGAVFKYGIPCVLFNLLSHLLEEPVLGNIAYEYLEEKLGTSKHELLQKELAGMIPNRKEKLHHGRWRLRNYKAHTRLYDITVNVLALASYCLVIVFMICIIGDLSALCFVLAFLPSVWCRVKNPTIERRAIRLAEGDIESFETPKWPEPSPEEAIEKSSSEESKSE